MKEYIVEYETEQIENGTFFYGGKIKHELIRCRNCAYFRPRSVYGNVLCDIHCNGIGDSAVANENDYCAWATLKETEHE